MDLALQQMSLAEFGELQRQVGTKVVTRHGHVWRQVRPFFYRPLLPIEQHCPNGVEPPRRWPCAFQYVVDDPRSANSSMDFLVIDDPHGYSLGALDHKRRCQINRANRNFQVRPLRALRELNEDGYKLYISFYERTKYRYLSNRTEKRVFETWAATVFRQRKSILLGAYGPSGLAAVACAYWVNRTLVYATLICGTDALRLGASDAVFHTVRDLAAREPGIREILASTYKGGTSHDQYYLLRGCKLVRKPARLEMPRLLHAILPWCLPRQYQLLLGTRLDGGQPAANPLLPLTEATMDASPHQQPAQRCSARSVAAR